MRKMWIAIAVLVGILTGCSGSPETPTPPPEPTRSWELQVLARGGLGPRNWSGAPLTQVEAYPGYVLVRFAINTASSPREMRDQALSDVTYLANLLSHSTGNAYDLRFEGLHPTVDKYGNEEMSEMLTIWLYKETLQKINWGNFRTSNLPKVADLYLEHPGLRRSSFQ